MEQHELEALHEGEGLIWCSNHAWAMAQPKIEGTLKRAARLGCVAPTLEVIVDEVVVVRYQDEAGRTHKRNVRWVGIKMTGDPVILEGWRFVAIIQMTEHGNVLRRLPSAPGEEELQIPRNYRDTGPELCEHCWADRKRKDAYLVYSEDEGWKQVGSSCLKDFSGGHNPRHAIWSAMAPLQLAEHLGELEGYACGRWDPQLDIEDFVAWCATAARVEGFVTRGEVYERGCGSATGDDVWRAKTHPPTDKRGHELEQFFCKHEDDPDFLLAAEALNWARNIDPDVGNEYLNNLRVLCLRDYVEARDVGFVASVIPAWQREKARRVTDERRKLAADRSQWVGNVKQRRTFELTMTRTTSWETDYGTTVLHVFEDVDGNVFTWCSSTGRKCEVGDEVSVTGTIKRHGKYHEVKQTELTRCKVSAL